jgi:Fe2+ transport system protein FeoA
MAAMRTTASLAELPPGARVVLVTSTDELRPALRLAELGLRPGCRLTVLARTAGGGRVVGVGHARIALGRAVARRLHVAAETV